MSRFLKRIGSKAYKILYALTLEEVRFSVPASGEMFVMWTRGSRSSTSEPFRVRDGLVKFDTSDAKDDTLEKKDEQESSASDSTEEPSTKDSLTPAQEPLFLVATLYRSLRGIFQKKTSKLIVKQFKKKKSSERGKKKQTTDVSLPSSLASQKTKTVGYVELDLAKCVSETLASTISTDKAASRFRSTMTLPLAKCSDKEATLTVTIQSQLVSSSGTDDITEKALTSKTGVSRERLMSYWKRSTGGKTDKDTTEQKQRNYDVSLLGRDSRLGSEMLDPDSIAMLSDLQRHESMLSRRFSDTNQSDRSENEVLDVASPSENEDAVDVDLDDTDNASPTPEADSDQESKTSMASKSPTATRGFAPQTETQSQSEESVPPPPIDTETALLVLQLPEAILSVWRNVTVASATTMDGDSSLPFRAWGEFAEWYARISSELRSLTALRDQFAEFQHKSTEREEELREMLKVAKVELAGEHSKCVSLSSKLATQTRKLDAFESENKQNTYKTQNLAKLVDSLKLENQQLRKGRLSGVQRNSEGKNGSSSEGFGDSSLTKSSAKSKLFAEVLDLRGQLEIFAAEIEDADETLVQTREVWAGVNRELFEDVKSLQDALDQTRDILDKMAVQVQEESTKRESLQNKLDRSIQERDRLSDTITKLQLRLVEFEMEQ